MQGWKSSRARAKPPPRGGALRCKGGALLALLLACALPIACQSTDAGSKAAAGGRAGREPEAGPSFSGQIAWQYMCALNQLGARVSGTRGAERSRAFLRDILERNEITTREVRVLSMVSEGDIVELTHLLAIVPGHSTDVMLLAAHYDTPRDEPEPLHRDDGRASGSALLLELAGALQAGPTPPYTIWLTWIDGDALASDQWLGTHSLADEWSRSGELDDLRTAVFFGEVGDHGHPIARDIDSPRIYREVFWEAAGDLGLDGTFPADSHYGRPHTGRSTFAQATMRSSIAIAHSASASREGVRADAGEPAVPHASAQLEAVGRVTLEALARTASKLRKIDRFAQSPLTAGTQGAGQPPAAR
ncbi:MAG: M28 family peptidase [bacterium]|nr:M28 family peptidase [bacterium]